MIDSNLALTAGFQLQMIELFCRSAKCENPVEKTKLEKGFIA